jgi:phospholipase C
LKKNSFAGIHPEDIHIGAKRMGMENIEHVVVVMMENRSFDNLLGWLYDDATDPAPFNIPSQTPTTFEGLAANTYFNTFGGNTIFASQPPTGWPPANDPNVVPTPDPEEAFNHIAVQLYGTASPVPGTEPDMSGFLADYATTGAGAATAGQIMQSFGPGEASVINGLARSFAVCDRWFASVPAQTWPNRGFVHAGSSDGHINNDNYEVYDIPTIFNVLEAQGHSWGIFHDTTLIPSLTRGQFLPQLFAYADRSHQYTIFKTLCQAAATAPPAKKLPQYSFVEPRFVAELGLFKIDYPSDYHPPHDVCRGEIFLADVYQAVRNSPYRDKILLVITFDEHGGCYDHVPPPSGAAAPDPWPTSRDGRFDFSRFGVRVPTIVISSYVQPGTVFRASTGEAPYDHTSILATLRDWLSLEADTAHPFLPSPRIRAAPTLDRVLTLNDSNKNTVWPDISAPFAPGTTDESLQTPLNDVQKSLIATTVRMNPARAAPAVAAPAEAAVTKSLRTYEDAINFLHPDAP